MRKNALWKISLIWLVFVMALSLTASASEMGSITLQMTEECAGVMVTLYSIADYEDGTYIYRDAFADSGLVINDLGNASEVQEAAVLLAQYAKQQKINGTEKTVGQDGTVYFSELAPALYLAAQTAGEEYAVLQPTIIPIPYTSDQSEGWIYDAVLTPKYSFLGGAVIVHKVDEEGNTVGNAEFVLQQKVYTEDDSSVEYIIEEDEKGKFYWKDICLDLISDQNGQIVVTDMPLGIYRLIEVKAPEGFVLNDEPVVFSITKAGKVIEVNGFYETESGTPATLTVLNEQTSVLINKVDEQGNPVSGARLVVKSVDGKAIVDEEDNALYAFVSGEEPYELKRLPAGDYLLSEVEAPAGYEVSEDVPFTVDDTNGAVNEVTMVDHPKKETDVKLTVTKTLEDQNGYAVASEEAVFYVALFEDAEYTKRVSDVRAIHFSNSSSESIVFENLEAGKTYYIVETDQYGELLDGIPYIGGVFAPEYPQGNAVTLTPQDPEQEYAFKNIFYDLPQDYYYIGEITVQKNVLRGDKPYESQAVFYAGIFTDEECTELYGEVITLSMDGKAETAVTVTVSVGRLPDGIATYYIAETDRTGKVLSTSDSLNFTISIDQPSVTLSPEKPSVKVIITNSYEEDEEWQSEAQTEEHSDVQTPGGSTSTGNSNAVKTGDETPVEMMVVVMMAAAMVMFVAGRRNRMRSK